MAKWIPIGENEELEDKTIVFGPHGFYLGLPGWTKRRNKITHYMDVPEHFNINQNGWKSEYRDEHPQKSGWYIVSLSNLNRAMPSSSVTLELYIQSLYYDVKAFRWYAVPKNKEVLAFRSFPSKPVTTSKENPNNG